LTASKDGGVEIEAACEDSEAREELALLGGQQLEAPVDRGAQCLLAGR